MTIICKCGFETTFLMDKIPSRHKCYKCKNIIIVKKLKKKKQV